jgi:beta-lactamase class C
MNKWSLPYQVTLMDLATHHSCGLPLQVSDGISDVEGLVSWLKDWHPLGYA